MTIAHTPVAQLNELIRDIRFAMLTTIRADGSVHCCPMATQEADAEGHLWFFTRTRTEKVEAIRGNNNVCLAYADPKDQRFVSITGVAHLLNPPEKKQALWNPLYDAWFPRGLDDPNLVLIKVLITDVQYWQESEGKMMQLPGFAEGISGQQYRPAAHREVEFPENQPDRSR